MPARNIVIGQKVSSAKVQLAKELRRKMTPAEKMLWQAVRADRLNGWHFRRQQIIGGFIVDFYCHAAALAFELDGGIHADQQEYDQERTELINLYGVEVVRFKNDQILRNLPRVLQEIDDLCRHRVILPSSA